MADAPVDALLARVESITKGWLVALLEQTPLEAAGAILAADVVRDGPRVCDAVIRSLASDADLRRLEPGGALEQLVARTGELSAVTGPAAASAAVDALHGVLWSAVRDELHHPEPEQVSELAQRLTLAIELVRDAALRRLGPGERRASPAAEVGEPADGTQATSVAGPADPTQATSVGGPADATQAPSTGESEAPVPDRESEAVQVERPAPHQANGVREPIAVVMIPEPPAVAESSRDALWIGAFQEEISNAERSGTPLSLLLVELEDGERVRAVEPPAVASATLGRFAQAVRDAVRRPDIIASESETRAWVIARETSRSGAQALAARLGEFVRAAEPWRGAPMTVSIGIGVLGEDGRDVDSLIEAAEESRFAAAASGVDVVREGGDYDPPPAEEEGSG